MEQIPEVIKEALSRFVTKGGEHNSSTIGFEDYCIFGEMSAADFIHREATRVCALAQSGKLDQIEEHLVDIIVFSILMSEYRKGKQE